MGGKCFIFGMFFLLVACGDNLGSADANDTDAPTETFSVGGIVNGLNGNIVLQNNAGDDVLLDMDGAFTFPTNLDNGATYAVTVETQPNGQDCQITNGTGTISGSDVNDILVDCTNTPLFLFIASGGNGDLGGVSGADAACNADMNKPNNSNYKAFLVDGTNRVACTTTNCGGGTAEHVDWVLESNRDYERRDGTAIGSTDVNGLWSLPLTNPYDLAVGSNSAARIWVGLNQDWTTGAHCTGWTVSASGTGNHARRDAVDAESVNFSFQLCGDANAIACVEQL